MPLYDKPLGMVAEPVASAREPENDSIQEYGWKQTNHRNETNHFRWLWRCSRPETDEHDQENWFILSMTTRVKCRMKSSKNNDEGEKEKNQKKEQNDEDRDK